jgi:hypothetical protein
VNLGFEQLRAQPTRCRGRSHECVFIRELEKIGFVCTEAEVGTRSFYKFELLKFSNKALSRPRLVKLAVKPNNLKYWKIEISGPVRTKV